MCSISKQVSILLEELVLKYNTPDFIENDPIQFPRKFKILQDIEISGFIISVISWGRRNMILHNANKILEEMHYSPYEYILNGEFKTGKESIHRTFKWDDYAEICRSLMIYYRENHSLENLFINKNNEFTFNHYKNLLTNSHISHWEKGSASKRLHMFLRWMVRDDGIVDIGCWKNIKSSDLFIPLDTHVAKNARKLNLLNRKSNDRKAVEELTGVLKTLCENDPVKYDFALFGANNNI